MRLSGCSSIPVVVGGRLAAAVVVIVGGILPALLLPALLLGAAVVIPAVRALPSTSGAIGRSTPGILQQERDIL